MTSPLDSLIEELQLEREVLEIWYAESLELLNGATDAQLEALGGRHEAMQRLEREHQERMADIQEAGQSMTLEGFLGAGADMLGALGSINEKALKTSQIFAAAEAWISTMKGAAKELEKGTFGFATAAAVITKGTAFVAAINSTSEKTKGGGSSGSSGGEAAAATPAALPTQRVDLAYSGPDIGMQSLVDTLNEAAARGYRLDVRLVAS